MIPRLVARAKERLSTHFPERADALIDACAPAWEALAQDRHLPHTAALVDALPKDGWQLALIDEAPTLQHPAVTALPHDARRALEGLRPWRKGPLAFADVAIDAEWRSEKKWTRIEGLLPELGGRTIVDVGSNNGWYAHRMQHAGADRVFCVEPTSLYVAQALCIEALIPTCAATTLPVGLDVLAHTRRDVDLLLLMGILYHHPDPLQVLRLCAQALRAGGHLLVETIVIPGTGSHALFVPGRYTGAKGFYWLPTMDCLQSWIRRAGLKIVEALEPVPTTADEQRTTAWRGGDTSLAEGLAPDDPTKTIEGHPAPLRTALLCALA